MIQAESQNYLLPVGLPLTAGGLLMHAEIAYDAYGSPSAGAPIVLLHDITSSHHALADPEPSLFKPSGWGLPWVGPGRVIDPADHFILSPNLLGSPYGSTSPAKVGPDGVPMGTDFPSASTEDMARACAALIRGIGLKSVRVVVGVGLGGMVALHLAALFPDLVRGVVALGASARLPARIRDAYAKTRAVLEADPAFKQGAYFPGPAPLQALKALRLDMLRDFYPKAALIEAHGEMAAGERRLESEAEAFAKQFDANAFALLRGAYASCDLVPLLSRLTCRVLLVACSTDAYAPPIEVRGTYHSLMALGVRAHYYEFDSDRGRAGMLKDAPRLGGAIGEFLATLGSA